MRRRLFVDPVALLSRRAGFGLRRNGPVRRAGLPDRLAGTQDLIRRDPLDIAQALAFGYDAT